jgi:hypothetical protein
MPQIGSHNGGEDEANEKLTRLFSEHIQKMRNIVESARGQSNK